MRSNLKFPLLLSLALATISTAIILPTQSSSLGPPAPSYTGTPVLTPGCSLSMQFFPSSDSDIWVLQLGIDIPLPQDFVPEWFMNVTKPFSGSAPPVKAYITSAGFEYGIEMTYTPLKDDVAGTGGTIAYKYAAWDGSTILTLKSKLDPLNTDPGYFSSVVDFSCWAYSA